MVSLWPIRIENVLHFWNFFHTGSSLYFFSLSHSICTYAVSMSYKSIYGMCPTRLHGDGHATNDGNVAIWVRPWEMLHYTVVFSVLLLVDENAVLLCQKCRFCLWSIAFPHLHQGQATSGCAPKRLRLKGRTWPNRLTIFKQFNIMQNSFFFNSTYFFSVKSDWTAL